MADRVQVSLECSQCGSRNYRTSKAANDLDRLVLKKFCKTCGQHTEHRESR